MTLLPEMQQAGNSPDFLNVLDVYGCTGAELDVVGPTGHPKGHREGQHMPPYMEAESRYSRYHGHLGRSQEWN